MKQPGIGRVVESDVLVIGGGGAGIWAAVEASRAGASVALVCKGKVGNSGNTIMIGGNYSMDGESAKNLYGFAEADDSLTGDYLLEQIVKQSFYLAEQDLAEQYVQDSPAVVYETWRWCEEAKVPQTFVQPASFLLGGRGLGRGLLHGLQKQGGTELYEDVMAVDLLTRDGRAVGAVGVEVYTGEVILFSARSVVVATGGYQPFTVKNTNSDMTGDGMAMAWRAGAELADLEFHLFIPTALEPAEYCGSLLPFMYECLTGQSLPSLDAAGRPIVVPPEMAEVAEGSELEKLINTYYWAEAIQAGRGLPDGGVYFDFSHLSDEHIRRTFDEFAGHMSPFYKPGFYHGEDIGAYRDFVLANRRVKMGAIDEYTMGGILIDAEMRTTVEGLFAAGEAGSGVFGACRIADATTEMLVQGWKAGRTAAAYALETSALEWDKSQADGLIERLCAPLSRAGGPSGIEVVRAIEAAADRGFGVCRDEAGLTAARAELTRIGAELLPALSVSGDLRYNYDWIRALQAENLWLLTLAGVEAALLRKESRGFHMRWDHREVDNDNWAARILVGERDGGFSLRTRKARETRFPIPGGREPSIPAFIKSHDLNLKNTAFLK